MQSSTRRDRHIVAIRCSIRLEVVIPPLPSLPLIPPFSFLFLFTSSNFFSCVQAPLIVQGIRVASPDYIRALADEIGAKFSANVERTGRLLTEVQRMLHKFHPVPRETLSVRASTNIDDDASVPSPIVLDSSAPPELLPPDFDSLMPNASASGGSLEGGRLCR